MRIELAGWTSEGLRCPDVEIKLMTDDRIAPVLLIQMPNGTGKTTTLTMIRAAMNGEAQGWTAGKIKSLRRPSESHSEGKFILNLRVDDPSLTIPYLQSAQLLGRHLSCLATHTKNQFEIWKHSSTTPGNLSGYGSIAPTA